MRLTRALPAALAVIALTLTGCSGEEDTADVSTSGTSDTPSSSESTGDSDRVFDSTDDAVIASVEAALDPQKVEWDGKSLRVYVDGSADDPTAGLNCLTLNSLIADDEKGVFVYSDGEYDCDQRR